MDLTYFFKTKDQAADFSARLSEVSQKIYQVNFNLEDALTDQFGIKKKDRFIVLLRENNVSIDSNEEIEKFFNKIQQVISSLPVLSITMAFEAKDQTLQALSDWFIMNVKKPVLFDIKADPALVAGVVITYNGKYLDYSIRPQFELKIKEALEAKKIKSDTPPQIQQNIEHISISR